LLSGHSRQENNRGGAPGFPAKNRPVATFFDKFPYTLSVVQARIITSRRYFDKTKIKLQNGQVKCKIFTVKAGKAGKSGDFGRNRRELNETEL
jgi:hypothetical protein